MPTHSHHIAKNLLDLLGETLPGLPTRRRSLLYRDDSQIHALVVTCRHGERVPMISSVARPLGSLFAALDLVMQSAELHGDEDQRCERSRDFNQAIEQVRDMQEDEAVTRNLFGDQGFETILRLLKRQAQECLLGGAVIRPFHLAQMYNVAGFDLSATWEQIFATTPLRICLSELPQISGTSKLWKQQIEQKLHIFQAKWGWLVNPLLIPVALEVVIKPPPANRQNGWHDLDNVLRNYVIPRFIDVLKPVSHHAFTRDERAPCEPLRIGGKIIRVPTPPASTKFGVTRYEAWRLPPAEEGSRGFVSVAIVADISGHDDTLRRIDDEVERRLRALENR